MRRMSWTIMVLLLGLVAPAMAATRLGLHVTQEELDIWRVRAVSGPYRVANDAGAASTTPGDWTRIEANKNTFMASSDPADQWSGYTGSGCVPNSSSIEPHNQAINMRDAAFWALVKAVALPTEAASVRAKVRTALLAQVATSGTDFGNSSKWCTDPATNLDDLNPVFVVGQWAARILYAYDYIRSTLSVGDQSTIESWLSEAGTYFRLNSDQAVVNLYSDWNAGTLNASGTAVANDCIVSYGLTHQGGQQICAMGRRYNNRRAFQTAVYAQIGIMLNDATMQTWAKNWVREYIKYHIYPTTTLNELHRNQGRHPDQGWSYAAQTWGKVMDIVDSFARNGDTSLYDLTTTGGSPGMTGTAKSVKFAANFFTSTTQGTFLIYDYWSAGQTVSTLIDAVIPGDGNYWGYDVWMAQPNGYWKDTTIRTAYLNPGAANKQGTTSVRDADWSWMGSGKSHPGKLFMFGQMADDQTANPGLNPYNLTGDTLAPKAPTSPSVTALYPSQNSVGWVAPTENTDNSALTDLAGYQIIYCAGPSCQPTITDIPQRPTTPTSYVHTGLQPGTTYRYVIQAVDDDGNHSASSTPVQETQTPPAGLVAHWPMNDGSGTTVDDAIGTLNGTFVGNATPTWPAPGKVGSNALTFDGINDFVRVSDNAALDFLAAQDFTIAMWVRSNQAAALDTWPSLLNKVAATPDDGIDIGLHDSNTGTWYGSVWVNGVWFPVGNRAGNTCTNIATGVWRHIAVKRQGTTLSVYQDGALCDSLTDPAIDDTLANAIDLRLGVWSSETIEEYAGDLDDVRIYNSALSPEAIGALFSTPSVLGLTHWRLHTPGRAENTEWLAPEDQARTLRQNGQVRMRFGLANSGSETSTQGYPLQCRKDQGAYTTMTTLCSTNGLCLQPDQAVTNGQAGTVQLTVPGGTTFAQAAFVTDQSWPAITIDPAEVGELEYHLVTVGIAPGVVVCCRPIKGDLTNLDDYPTPPGVPCLTVSAGSGGILSR